MPYEKKDLLWETEAKNVTVGECIYCGSKESLTNEHSIPFSLYGRSQLLKASCRDCAEKTAKFEGYVSSYLWKKPREIFGFPTRKAKKEGRWNSEGAVQDEYDGVHLVPLSLSMPVLIFPYYESLPLCFMKNKRDVPKVGIKVVSFVDVVISSICNPIIKFKIKPREFFKLIVKIAYCEFIRTYDKDFRNYRLAKLIIGGNSNLSFYVGTTNKYTETSRLHEIGFKILKNSDKKSFIVARVRLFSYLASPTYFVVLGECPSNNNYNIPEQELGFIP